ncbi:hypothetical protein NIES2100_51430 [Calothrix sp. NIES-2100]|uniref:hypothetical protein n=1 Tax=Calothrix sp. NIES-2100 TaxID=1954172 RepID=UPI000B5F8CBB|nr:hypothetical protein NIES2100_51430 [Calothrix sp. NIES-2100]
MSHYEEEDEAIAVTSGGLGLLIGVNLIMGQTTKAIASGLLNWGSRLLNWGSRLLNWGSRLLNWGSRSLNWGSRLLNWGSRLLNWGSRLLNLGSRLLNSGHCVREASRREEERPSNLLPVRSL